MNGQPTPNPNSPSPAPKPAPTADASGGQNARHVSIALSTIIASIWAGIWGFDWAASHLPAGALFVAVLIGLVFGTALTVYTLKESFQLMREVMKTPGAHGDLKDE